jgi:HSP20 family protein
MTTLTRWEPIRELADMRRNMDRMMERFFDEPFFAPAGNWSQGNGGAWSLPLDVTEKEDAYFVKASVPGINPEDIEITLHDNVLTIKGETKAEKEDKQESYHVRELRYGSFMRNVTLPMSVDADKVEATNENGVLTLRIPKAEAVKPKRITVKNTVQQN